VLQKVSSKFSKTFCCAWAKLAPAVCYTHLSTIANNAISSCIYPLWEIDMTLKTVYNISCKRYPKKWYNMKIFLPDISQSSVNQIWRQPVHILHVTTVFGISVKRFFVRQVFTFIVRPSRTSLQTSSPLTFQSGSSVTFRRSFSKARRHRFNFAVVLIGSRHGGFGWRRPVTVHRKFDTQVTRAARFSTVRSLFGRRQRRGVRIDTVFHVRRRWHHFGIRSHPKD